MPRWQKVRRGEMRRPECLLDLPASGGDQVVTAAQSRPISSHWSRFTGWKWRKGESCRRGSEGLRWDLRKTDDTRSLEALSSMEDQASAIYPLVPLRLNPGTMQQSFLLLPTLSTSENATILCIGGLQYVGIEDFIDLDVQSCSAVHRRCNVPRL